MYGSISSKGEKVESGMVSGKDHIMRLSVSRGDIGLGGSILS
jgi:hypothetical protein